MRVFAEHRERAWRPSALLLKVEQIARVEATEVRRPGVTGTVRHEVVDAAALLEPPEDPLEAAIREWLTGIREEERAVAGLR